MLDFFLLPYILDIGKDYPHAEYDNLPSRIIGELISI